MVQEVGDWLVSGQVRFHKSLGPLLVDIDSVHPAPYNYNNGDVDAIEQSIRHVGMYRPIYVQASTEDIVAGNHTWLACKQMESRVIPRIDLDWDDEKAKRAMVADNEIARKAQPDKGLLLDLLDQIKEHTGDIEGTGITEEEMDTLRALNDIPLDTEEFAQWPTFTVQVPPHVLRGFRYMTREADDDRQAFELILRLAGWDGR